MIVFPRENEKQPSRFVNEGTNESRLVYNCLLPATAAIEYSTGLIFSSFLFSEQNACAGGLDFSGEWRRGGGLVKDFCAPGCVSWNILENPRLRSGGVGG